ncbi:MAG TPA: hypothetical protein VME23_05115 [Terracidiphilus sp.]|nr:hypothetical protein [Terracidiphilus sp.]
MRVRGTGTIAAVVAGLAMAAWPAAMGAQASDATQQANNEAAKNAQQARAALDSMVQAMGGQAWLDMKNKEIEGHVAAFYHGNPDLGTTLTFEFHQWPDHDRIEVTKHRDVVEFFIGREGWEVTYRGKRAMDKEILDDYLRRRDHSIETAIKVWLKDPNTILVYEGTHMVERREAVQVTLISAQNEAITILMDSSTHLPLRSEFQWRDPLYHDKNTDAEEYDDYHTIDGFPTAFTITRFKNGDMSRQYYVTGAKYNLALPADFWDVDATARRIKKK